MTGLSLPPGKPPAAQERSTWERWIVIWHVIFYLTLIPPAILALFSKAMRYPPGFVLGLSLALGAWYGIMMVWRLPLVQARRQWAWSIAYLVGAIALWIPLAHAHPAFFLTASSFFGLMWGTLPFGLAAAGNLLLTGAIVWLQFARVSKPVVLSPTYLIISAVAFGWSLILALWMRAVMRESAERKRLIEQLETAQANLAAAERQAGILQERQRLAQEIHDTLAQGFTSIIMQLEAAEPMLPQEHTAARGHLEQARDTARSSLAEARRLVQALRPESLVGASLPDALQRVANRWSRESSIQADFTVTGDARPLPPEADVTLLRAAQEALANIQKHAQAHAVSITLSYMSDQVALDIHDDGRGFDPDSFLGARANKGYGLQAMRERLAQLHGELIIESAPGQGTTLAVQIPLDVQPEDSV